MGIVYAITIPTGEQYIGSSSKSATNRWQHHKGCLRRGRGPRLLQEAYNTHGEEALDFDVLVETADYLRIEREVIRELNPALNHAYTTRSVWEMLKRARARSPDGRKRKLWTIGDEQLTGLEITARYGEAVMTRVYAGDPDPLRPRNARRAR